jgi:hypothetical protein
MRKNEKIRVPLHKNMTQNNLLALRPVNVSCFQNNAALRQIQRIMTPSLAIFLRPRQTWRLVLNKGHIFHTLQTKCRRECVDISCRYLIEKWDRKLQFQ